MKHRFLAVLVAAILLAAAWPAYPQVSITNLPAATTPLAGSEILPLVQGGTTKQSSATNVSAVFGNGGTLTNGTISGGTFSGTIAGSPTLSGVPLFSGGFGITGGTGAPGGDGQGYLNASATNGLWLAGRGSSLDFLLQNKTPSTVCSIATGTTNFNCVGLQVGGTAVLTGNQTITLSGDASGSGATSITVTNAKVNGVAYAASPSTNTTPIITASNTATYTAIPNCTDTAGQHLNYATATSTFSCGTSKTASGTLTTGTALTMNPVAANTTQTQAHGLGAEPTFIKVILECLSADLNYSVGDRINIGSFHISNTVVSFYQILVDATNVTLITKSSGSITILDKTLRSSNAITVANWKLIITPYLLN